MGKPTVVYFDLETTGLDVQISEVLQIGATAGSNMTFNAFIMPEGAIAEDASRVNGLRVKRGQLLQHGEPVETIKASRAWRHFVRFLRDAGPRVVLVGHNSNKFDFPMLARCAREHDLDGKLLAAVTGGCADSLPILQARLPSRNKFLFKLEQLAAAYQVPADDAHDALGDAKMLRKICKAIGVTSSDFLQGAKPMSSF